MVWEGLDAVKQGRQMLGTTNPLQSLPGSIRGDFRYACARTAPRPVYPFGNCSIQTGRNIVHGSDAVDSAQREIAHWFKPEEQVKWSRTIDTWVYE
jgi:nucleoside-diphosphate kinase